MKYDIYLQKQTTILPRGSNCDSFPAVAILFLSYMTCFSFTSKVAGHLLASALLYTDTL